MIYVLMIVGSLGGYVSGPVVMFQELEFTSQARCEAAAKIVSDYAARAAHIKAVCLPK